MLLENTLFGEVDKVATAIARLQEHEPSEGYYGAFSGGKDSCVIKALAGMAGLKQKVDWVYSLTTVDPPELVQFIKYEHPDVEIKHPPLTMWQLIVKKTMPPTRMVRYCCDVLKEQGGHDRVVITGVRRAESFNRSKRGIYEQSYRHKKQWLLNPIIDWTDSDVWEFIKENNIPYCSLYDEGFKRLGCVGCPMAGSKKQQLEFKRWPKLEQGYMRAFGWLVVERKQRGLPCQWDTAQDVMNWWLKLSGPYGHAQCDDDQSTIFE